MDVAFNGDLIAKDSSESVSLIHSRTSHELPDLSKAIWESQVLIRLNFRWSGVDWVDILFFSFALSGRGVGLVVF